LAANGDLLFRALELRCNITGGKVLEVPDLSRAQADEKAEGGESPDHSCYCAQSAKWDVVKKSMNEPVEPKASYRLRGTDAAEWLHGQVTQDILSMRHGDVREACLCAVTGQIRSVLSIECLNDGLTVTLPASTADYFENRFEETIFMEEVFLERIEPPLDSGTVSEANRLEMMIPAFGKDIDDKTFPQELGKEFERWHMSYTKGCYTGQEVLMRIHSRGHTNRLWVQLRCEALVPTGSDVLDSTGRKVGKVTSAAMSPEFGPLAAAMIRNEVSAPGTRLYVGGKPAVVSIPTST
jgi:folate-binding protein YgfZ